MTLTELEPTAWSLLPFTRYYEIDSEHVGTRFGVWVTVPPTYEADQQRYYPAIYLPDGNQVVPVTAGSHMLPLDPIAPIRPFVHVGVGYVGAEAVRQLAVRARDLLPPGEPMFPGVSERSLRRLVDTGVLDPLGAKLYLHNLENPAGDRFLAFLTDELHPRLSERYRIDINEAGLFGYSFGGLFAIYAALSRSPLFRRIGAGSPGIVATASKVFSLYQAQLAAFADHSQRMLHVTVCARELEDPSYYRTIVGQGTLQLLSLAQRLPLSGLSFSSHVIPHESHHTGLAASWFSFLRACYAPEAKEL